ncbi:hypothetical protein GEMRC1_009005 [Eukaryota sp. GEM-RC1]
MTSLLDSSIDDVIMIKSQLMLYNSNISACISNDIFKNSFYLENSRLFLVDLDNYLFLSSLTLLKSNCSFYSNFPIISKSITIDEDSLITGSDSVVDLSELSSNISISPSKHCCNTSFCQVSVQFDDIFVLENLMSISVNQSQSFNYLYHLESLSLVLEHSKSFNYSAPSILLNFIIDQILFSYQLFIPICPIEFVSLEPPTRGGLVPLLLLILGWILLLFIIQQLQSIKVLSILQVIIKF